MKLVETEADVELPPGELEVELELE